MNSNLTQSRRGAEKERRGHGRLDRERHSTTNEAKPLDCMVGLARRCRPKPQARTRRLQCQERKRNSPVRNLAPPYWQILDFRSSTGLLPPERNLNLWFRQVFNPWKQKNLVQPGSLETSPIMSPSAPWRMLAVWNPCSGSRGNCSLEICGIFRKRSIASLALFTKRRWRSGAEVFAIAEPIFSI